MIVILKYFIFWVVVKTIKKQLGKHFCLCLFLQDYKCCVSITTCQIFHYWNFYTFIFCQIIIFCHQTRMSQILIWQDDILVKSRYYKSLCWIFIWQDDIVISWYHKTLCRIIIWQDDIVKSRYHKTLSRIIIQ